MVLLVLVRVLITAISYVPLSDFIYSVLAWNNVQCIDVFIEDSLHIRYSLFVNIILDSIRYLQMYFHFLYTTEVIMLPYLEKVECYSVSVHFIFFPPCVCENNLTGGNIIGLPKEHKYQPQPPEIIIHGGHLYTYVNKMNCIYDNKKISNNHVISSNLISNNYLMLFIPHPSKNH